MRSARGLRPTSETLFEDPMGSTYGARAAHRVRRVHARLPGRRGASAGSAQGSFVGLALDARCAAQGNLNSIPVLSKPGAHVHNVT